jgi:ATP-dependent helicase YprA (DUF1998 family)
MHWDPEKVRENIRTARTSELLDRITVFRAGLEPEAIRWIEEELRRRDVDASEITQHAAAHAGVLSDGDVAIRCAFCERPAVARRWGWERLWNLVPVFPMRYSCCTEHAAVPIGRIHRRRR